MHYNEMEVGPCSSEETIFSSDETIPYCDERECALSICASTISLESDSDNDVGELYTHHYIPDGPPAPFSEPFPLEENLPTHQIRTPDSEIDIQNTAPSTSPLHHIEPVSQICR